MLSNIHLLFTLTLPLLLLFPNGYFKSVNAQPIFKDPNLKAELVVEGLSSPTSMAFVNNKDILVLEKNNGEVRLVSNSILQKEPVLKVNVDNTTLTCCRGLLGIATINNNKGSNNVQVFLYLSEAAKDNQPVKNRVYKYQWNEDNNLLVNPTFILDLPAEGLNHPGGKLVMGPDHYLYAAIGDLNREGKLQNIKDGPEPDDTSVILRVNPDNGSRAKDNPLITNNNYNNDTNAASMSRYFAYGIRNCFGMAFDPVTRILWDTENGDKDYDEINIVHPGFNSGWKQVMGPISTSDITEDQLVIFPGSHYADPVFNWKESIGVTDIEFLNSSKLGAKYANNLFVGDITAGNLYFFEVNASRTGLRFESIQQADLADLAADNTREVSAITLATGFGGITDIITGPDGFLYILTFNEKAHGEGKIYRISAVNDNNNVGSNNLADTGP